MNARTAHRSLFALLLAALLPWIGAAVADSPLLRDDAMTAHAFPAEAQRIEQALSADAWPRLGPGGRAQVSDGLRRIAALLAAGDDKGRELARSEQVRINALLAPALAAGNTSDVVCRRVKPVGSNIPTTVCHRRATLEDHSRDLQNELINQADIGLGGPSIDERNSTIQGRGYGRD